MPHLSSQTLIGAEQRRLRRMVNRVSVRDPSRSRSGTRCRMERGPTMLYRASMMMRFVHRLRWLPIIHSFRTLCLAPTEEVRAVFNELRGFARAG